MGFFEQYSALNPVRSVSTQVDLFDKRRYFKIMLSSHTIIDAAKDLKRIDILVMILKKKGKTYQLGFLV